MQTNPISVSDDDLPLQSFYRWEREKAQQVYLSQPLGDGVVRDITWAQADDEVRRMAQWLKAQGWPAGSAVAILGKNSAHWILADLAIWMAGHVSVPIYPTFNGEALAYVLGHCEAKACFVGKLDGTGALPAGVPAQVPLIRLPLAPTLPPLASRVLEWDALVAQQTPLAGQPLRQKAELCTLIYTSGTTGNPKGVMHSFATMAWSLSAGMQRLPMFGHDRYLSYLPLAHVVERMLVELGSLRNGSRVFFAESLDTFVQDVQRARPTVFFSVPRLWVKFQQGVFAKVPPAKLQRLLGLPLVGWLVRRKLLKGLGLDQTRFAAGGAAPMPAELLLWFRSLGLDLIEGYGMTENCGVSHAVPPGQAAPGTVGPAYQGVECRIAPENGEIQMRSPGVMLGYYKQPEQTAEALTADGWLRTGDKGHVDSQGFLHITGRVKDLFKTSKGKYVAPAPIEDRLINFPGLEACVVTGANFAQPLALVLLSPELAAQASQGPARAELHDRLVAHLKAVNAQLEPHEQLDCLAVVTGPWSPENGLVTPTLKVKRPRIEEQYSAHYEGWLAQRQPVVWTAL